MPTVTIRKHPTEDKIEVTPDPLTVKPGDRVTFEVSSANGWKPGTRVTVTFQKRYSVLGVARNASRRGPFRHRNGEAGNPREGIFDFAAAGEVQAGDIEDSPESSGPHEWKYDVEWTGLPRLDPIVKIEKGG